MQAIFLFFKNLWGRRQNTRRAKRETAGRMFPLTDIIIFGCPALWWWSNSIVRSMKLWCASVNNPYKWPAADAKLCCNLTCLSILNFDLTTILCFTLRFEWLWCSEYFKKSRVELFQLIACCMLSFWKVIDLVSAAICRAIQCILMIIQL